jgi:hypothetical protein
MYVFQSWIESLRLFLPKNVKLFTLVTFRAYYLALKGICVHFLGVFLGIVVVLIGLDIWQMYSIQSEIAWYVGFIVVLIRLLLVFLLLLTVRPSIALKNTVYYKNYRWYSIYVYLVFGLAFLTSWGFYTLVPRLTSWLVYTLTIGGSIESSLAIPTMVISPLLVCILLFILDTDGSLSSAVHAMVQGITMFVYNYPFCLLSFVFLHEYARIVTYIYGQSIAILAGFNIQSLSAVIAIISIHQLIFVVLSVLGGLLPLIWITNFYIKRVHEQYALYDE